MPQHGGNINQTTTVPYELDITPFQDPGVPDADGNLTFSYSYSPGLTYSCSHQVIAIKFRIMSSFCFLFSVIFKTRESSSNSGFRGFFTQARLMADDSNVGGSKIREQMIYTD